MSELNPEYTFYPLGDSALVVQFGSEIDFEVHKQIMALTDYLTKNPFGGFIELVPAYTTLTIYFDPLVVSELGKKDPYQKIRNHIQGISLHQLQQLKHSQVKIKEIPVCYGGNYGPDLDFVAVYNQLTPEEVVRIHSEGHYRVYMLGFSPGFPYLGGMNKEIAIPRKQTPARNVPAGSVGIAGEQTGIYPLETPGGWQIIGRTPLTLFNPENDNPCLFQAGDQIRFVPIEEKEFLELTKNEDR